jgi:Uma2 family endonuclease
MYAQLGIPEYFIYDRNIGGLKGYRLPSPASRLYSPIVPQHGAYRSEVLGIDLIAESDRIRFQVDGALVLESQELVDRLDRLMSEAIARADAVEEQLRESEQRIEEQARRLEEETRLREEAERRTTELLAELERLKSRRD